MPSCWIIFPGSFFGGLFRDSTFAGYLAPAVPLKWAMAPPAGHLIISGRFPLLLSDSFPCRTPVWFLRADSLTRRPGPAPFSKSIPGRWEMHIHPCPVRLSKCSHSHSHYNQVSSYKLPASYNSQEEFSHSLQSLDFVDVLPALCFSCLAFQRFLFKAPLAGLRWYILPCDASLSARSFGLRGMQNPSHTGLNYKASKL